MNNPTTESSVRIRKKDYPRIRYGDETTGDWGAELGPCHDCGVEKGAYHETGCDVEECPRCHRQSMFSACDSITNADLKAASKKQVQWLVRLGCDETWAKSLRSGNADREILVRDPVEAENRRHASEEKARRRERRLQERRLEGNHRKSAALKRRRREEEEWMIDFSDGDEKQTGITGAPDQAPIDSTL